MTKTVSQLLAEVEDYLVSQAADDDTKAFELAKEIRALSLRFAVAPRVTSDAVSVYLPITFVGKRVALVQSD